MDINDFWRTIRLIMIGLFIGAMTATSFMMLLFNEKERREQEEKEKIAIAEMKCELEIISQMVKDHPELFLGNTFKDSVLKNAGYYKVTATVYNPEAKQCDDSPLVTADMSMIDLDKLESGEIKWVALSRDLLENFCYGDKIYVHSESDPSINGVYEIHDTMNIRYRNYMDFLKPCGQRNGKWNDVVIKKVEES